MKKKMSVLLAGAMLATALTACGSNNASTDSAATATPEATVEASADTTTETATYTDGTYEGVGTGNNGEIKVSVTVEGGAITAVEVTEQSETEGIYENAEAAVPDAIVEAQSTDVDTVSGATNSSNGIIEAVNNALESAK